MHAADKPALILGDEALTHGQFQVLKDQVVAALQRDGIAPGDVIAVCAATSLAYVVTFMGCVQCGVVVAPLAPSSSAQDLAAMLANAQAKRLFTDAETLPRLPAPQTDLPRIALDDDPSVGSAWSSWLETQQADGYNNIALSGVDLSDHNACLEGAREIHEKHGPISVLVNCAGITRDGTMKKMSYEQWYQVIDTNLNSVFNTCRSVIEGMLENGYGRIINISSSSARSGAVKMAHYSSSKGGMIALTDCSPFVIGAEKGFFKKHGLDVTILPGEGVNL